MDPPQKSGGQAYPQPAQYAPQQPSPHAMPQQPGTYAAPQQMAYQQQQPAGPYAQGTPYMQPPMGMPPQQQQYGMPQGQQQYVYAQYQPGVPVAPMVGQPGAGQTVVVVEQNIYFGSQPTACVCPNCRNNVVTNTVYTPGALSWLACLGLCLVGLWPCAPIPFCVTGCQDVSHYCPACGVLIRRREALD